MKKYDINGNEVKVLAEFEDCGIKKYVVNFVYREDEQVIHSEPTMIQHIYDEGFIPTKNRESFILSCEQTKEKITKEIEELKEKRVSLLQENNKLDAIREALMRYKDFELMLDVLDKKAVFFVDENFNIKNFKDEKYEGKQKALTWSWVYNQRLMRPELVCEISTYSDVSGTQRPIEWARTIEEAHGILGEKYKHFLSFIKAGELIPYNANTICKKARAERFISDELIAAEAFLLKIREENKARLLKEALETAERLKQELGEI